MGCGTLLTLNPGSSSLKLGLYTLEADRPGAPRRLGKGSVALRSGRLVLALDGEPQPRELPLRSIGSDALAQSVEEILGLLDQQLPAAEFLAVGHRVVHGGDRFTGPAELTGEVLAQIEALAPLAPMHQPQSLALIRAVASLRPGLRQFASFDTAFHATQSDLVRRFALPRALFDEGIKRYGFHGLSYQSVATQLQHREPQLAFGRIVIAHLGSGASLCGLLGGTSRDASMGFSTLDGVPMATRCGALDPGVLLHLLKQRGLSVEALEDMLYHRSGLLGISDSTADVRELAGSTALPAREALELFAFRIARETAAIANTLGGLDAIVFTAGIGEHQPAVRQAVCRHLAWLGVLADDAANASNAARIHCPESKVALLVIPTDEEQVIADQTCALLLERK